MASISKHPLDIYQWIKKVINSCTSSRQIINCACLINGFNNKFPFYTTQYRDLITTEHDMYFTLIDRKFEK